MMTNTTLTAILNEKDVENLYRQYLTKKFGDIVFNSPFGCDGYGESKKHNVRILCEFKDDLDLSSKVNQVKVLSQVLYYIKKFEVSGKILPSVILVGDRNECFAIHTNEIFNYLGMDFNWSIAPSNAHTNVELVTLMIEDDRINPHVFNIKDIDGCISKIKDLTDGVKRLISITPHNITEVFKNFEDNVIGKTKLTTNEMANLFVQILINPDDNFSHPKKKNTLFTKSNGDIPLKSTQSFISFFSHFASQYTPKQKESLTAVVDRLIQDITRRKQGEFFTPTIWVDKAHEYIASVYGEDWKEKHVVLDPAWGTGNLTRDYKFKELYVSTLNYSDIQTAEQMGYNPEAVKVQFDFLNDDYDFLPQGLKNAIKNGKRIIVLMNSPYGTAASSMKTGKKGTAETIIGNEMKSKGYGKSSANLYAQFIYRLLRLSNHIDICMFTPPLFLTGMGFSELRKDIFKTKKITKGFLMDAKNFADVKSWGLTFSILTDKELNCECSSSYDILEINKSESTIDVIGNKIFYNTDSGNAYNSYVKGQNKTKNKIDFPHLSNPLNIVSKGTIKVSEDFLGYLNCNSNNVMYNGTLVGLYSGIFSGGGKGVGHSPGFSVNCENFHHVCMLFSARKSIQSNWINQKDEYLIPNNNHQDMGAFKYDSIIYSLFNNSSNQSSLRQITYKDELWDVKNQFFWMSKNEMTELANQGNYTELYNDARTDSDRYVHTLLFGEEGIYDQLSDEAKDVLDSASNLVRLSFGMRRNFADDTNHLNSWDAGYAQLKLLWKEYYPEQFKEFRAKYKVLEDKMRPMVYELGFLLK